MTDDQMPDKVNTGGRHLSKSKLMSLRQCQLRLWNEVYRRDKANPPSLDTQYRFDQGKQVGDLARRLYTGGVLIDAEYKEHEVAINKTLAAVRQETIPAVFEAGFEFNRTRIRCDLLARTENEWEIWEVKSVGTPKEIHLMDVAVQAYVARQAGLVSDPPVTISRCGIVHLNQDYIYDGHKYDPQGLFCYHDFTEEVDRKNAVVVDLIKQGLEIIDNETPPTVEPGDQCSNPYECPFLGTVCPVPKPSELRSIPGIGPKKQAKLEGEGIQTLADFIASNRKTTGPQKRMIEALQTAQCVVDPALKVVLSGIGYPRYHLDFETITPILPRYAGTRPIQVLPFQFSIHVERADGHPAEHVGYLHSEDTDPRRPLAEALLAFVEEYPDAPILMYATYEKRMIGELAAAFPDLRDRLEVAKARLVNLLAIVKKHVYHPDFGGSFSIKDVLPALVPDLGYEDLAIQEGMTASLRYLEMIELAKINANRAKTIWNDLRRYCMRDTEAMVAVMNALNQSH